MAEAPVSSHGEQVAKLVLDEAKRQLTNQYDALNNLRATTATLVTASSIVAAVFGAVLAAEKRRSGFSIGFEAAALVLFAASLWIAASLFRPRTWHGQHDLAKWIARIDRGDAPTVVTAASNFAEYLNNYRKDNNPTLLDMQAKLRIACLILGVQVILWAIAAL